MISLNENDLQDIQEHIAALKGSYGTAGVCIAYDNVHKLTDEIRRLWKVEKRLYRPMNIFGIANICKPGDLIHSEVWAEQYKAEITEITNDGVRMKGSFLVEGEHFDKFEDYKIYLKKWTIRKLSK